MRTSELVCATKLPPLPAGKMVSLYILCAYTLGHIGVFLTEFSRKAIISQYRYSSLATVNQDNHLNIIPGNL